MRRGRPKDFANEKDWLRSLVRSGADLSDAQINLRGVEVDRPSTARDMYFSLIDSPISRQDESHPYPVVAYARVLTGQEVEAAGQTLPDGYAPDDYAIQYWYFYFYNDWWNRHEMDWELAAIIVRPQEDGQWEPLKAGYAAHVSGVHRDWKELNFDPENPNSPLVFVAAGSHAAYFEYREQGYSTVARQVKSIPWLFRLVRWFIRRSKIELLSQDLIDLVPPNDTAYYVRPHIRMMPANPPRDDPHWWWMHYAGMWGEKPDKSVDLGEGDLSLINDGPRGPWNQWRRWDNPFLWVETGRPI